MRDCCGMGMPEPICIASRQTIAEGQWRIDRWGCGDRGPGCQRKMGARSVVIRKQGGKSSPRCTTWWCGQGWNILVGGIARHNDFTDICSIHGIECNGGHTKTIQVPVIGIPGRLLDIDMSIATMGSATLISDLIPMCVSSRWIALDIG